ncbi:EsV-1-189 [Ectocarpus siliculosus]|uniref:EsV-1-189 n=1 Tax=Ectocarpus siliculosus TaxID=2880 RepID=D8LPK8_ECTSI|nr:EsV-1-189 [Ectocarpus siliculosus]|eukprot:CBN80480.1 EsV-1-189 [Ectocarpus siliculosus]
MSARDCYELGHENCATDNRCVLEYNVENEHPTCVPRQMHRLLTDHEVRVLERVFEQVLLQFFRPENTASNVLDQSIQRLAHELRPRVEWNIRSLTAQGNIASWMNGVANVSQDIIREVNQRSPRLQQSSLQQVSPSDQERIASAVRRVQHERRRLMAIDRDVRRRQIPGWLIRRRAREAREARREEEERRERLAQRELDEANVELMANALVCVIICALILHIDVIYPILGEFFF